MNNSNSILTIDQENYEYNTYENISQANLIYYDQQLKEKINFYIKKSLNCISTSCFQKLCKKNHKKIKYCLKFNCFSGRK